jgi:hypothetical protein
MERSLTSRRARIFHDFGAGLLELAAHRDQLTAELGVIPFDHASGRPLTTLSILSKESRTSCDVPPSPGPTPFSQHQAPMRITHALQLETDLEFSHAAQDTFTVTADVTLSDEVTPIRWVSVERNGVAVTGFDLATLTAPLSRLEDAILTEALLRRSAMAKTAGADEARSVA